MSSAPDSTPDFLSALADSTVGRLLLADRRQVGQQWPTIPVPDAPDGVSELDCPQTACALFEMCTDQLTTPPEVLATDTLTAALTGAVRSLGVDDLRTATASFVDLDTEELPEVSTCWWLTHRLAVTFWYSGARSRPMTTGEVAACLYASGHRFADCQNLAADELRAAVHAGVDRLTGPEVVTAGRALTSEALPLSQRPDSALSNRWGDSERRRRCFHLARHHTPRLATPLVVQPDGHPDSLLSSEGPDGSVLLGVSVPPPVRHGTVRPLAWHW